MTQTEASVEQESLPAGFTRRHCDVAGRGLRYAEAGAGTPLLVIHGGSGWPRNLSSVHTDLATRYRVLAPELPGFGTTDGSGVESLRDLSGVMAGFLGAVGIERCSVLGSSLGGAVALWLAIDHPELVEQIILDGPAAFREGAPPPSPPPGSRAPAPSPERLAFMRRILEPATDADLVAALPGCEVPALVMFGQDDVFFGTRYASDYKRLPRCTVAIVYQATHDLKGSRPDAYLAMVADFLSRGPGFVVADKSTLIRA